MGHHHVNTKLININRQQHWNLTVPSKVHIENITTEVKLQTSGSNLVESLFLNARMTGLSDKGKVWPEVICPRGLVQCSQHPLTSWPDCQVSVMELPTSFLRYKIFPNFSLLHANSPQTSLNIISFCFVHLIARSLLVWPTVLILSSIYTL